MVLKLVYTENAHSDDPYFYEKFYFTPGDLGLKPFLQKENRTLICWDNGILKQLV
jgi:N-carbamoylputrescine amidase